MENALFTNSSNQGCNNSQHMDNSQQIFLGLFYAFLACVIFSFTANGFLFFFTTRYRRKLWQPPYALLINISICGIGFNLVVGLVVLLSVLQEQTQVYGRWCISQFCLLRCLFLDSQITLALMAIERYIFICHGIHYLRLVSSQTVSLSIGLAWLVSGTVSLHGGYVLSLTKSSFEHHSTGLLCEAVTIKRLWRFSPEENLQLFGPPSFIMLMCVLLILYCYVSMYHAALKVTKALRCNNRRANRTVGFYLLLFWMQLALNLVFVIFTLKENGMKISCNNRITSVLIPLICIIPYCISPAFLLIWNPQVKQLLLPVSTEPCGLVTRGNALEESGPQHKDRQHTDNTLHLLPVSEPEDLSEHELKQSLAVHLCKSDEDQTSKL